MADISPVRDFIRREFLYDRSAPLAEDTVLFPDLVDSLGIMTVVEFIEEKYGITIDDDELEAERFETLNSINAFIDEKIAG